MNMPMIEIFVTDNTWNKKQFNNQNLIYGQINMAKLEWMKESPQHTMFIMPFNKIRSNSEKSL